MGRRMSGEDSGRTVRGVSSGVTRRKATGDVKHMPTSITISQCLYHLTKISQSEKVKVSRWGKKGTKGRMYKPCKPVLNCSSWQLKHNTHHRATCTFAENETYWFFQGSGCIYANFNISVQLVLRICVLHTLTYHGILIYLMEVVILVQAYPNLYFYAPLIQT